jgi:hypothetical protein
VLERWNLHICELQETEIYQVYINLELVKALVHVNSAGDFPPVDSSFSGMGYFGYNGFQQLAKLNESHLRGRTQVSVSCCGIFILNNRWINIVTIIEQLQHVHFVMPIE